MAVGAVASVTFFVLFSTIPAEGLPLPNTLDRPGYNCKEGEYLDHGTRHCEACCDICCHADITGTAKMCDEECPGYLSNKKRDSFDTKTAQPAQTEWPQNKETHKNSSKTDPSAKVSIALGIFIAVSLVGTPLAIVWSRRRPPDRSGRYRRDAVPLQCGQQASPLESSHRPQVSEDVPLKTPVQECGDGYHEAWETQHNTVPKTILLSASEESLETV